MPVQKPGRSKQDYGTPPELLAAIKHKLRIEEFDIDLAASEENKVAVKCYTEENSAFKMGNSWKQGTGWNWCNPPFADIEPWVRTAAVEAYTRGAQTAVLVPLSLSEWWVNWVEDYAYKLLLHGRIKFVGAEQGYPKDCAILLYTPYRAKGSELWDWRPRGD